jgi:hypothetical protein
VEKPWKNELHVSHRFPTALGKLGKKQLRRVSHSYRSPYGLLSSRKEGNSTKVGRLDQIVMDTES